MEQHTYVLQQIRKSTRHSPVTRHHITQVKPHGLEKLNTKFMLRLLYSPPLTPRKKPHSPDWVVPGLGLNSLVVVVVGGRRGGGGGGGGGEEGGGGEKTSCFCQYLNLTIQTAACHFPPLQELYCFMG
jgi:hypothetical protein